MHLQGLEFSQLHSACYSKSFSSEGIFSDYTISFHNYTVILKCLTLISASLALTVAMTSPIDVVSNIFASYVVGSNFGLARFLLTLTRATVVSVRGGLPPSLAIILICVQKN